MIRYTVVSTAYRLFAGTFLVVINWQIATAEGGGYWRLVVSTLLSYLPALAVPLVLRRITISGQRLSVLSLLYVAAVSFVVSFLVENPTALVVANLFMWIGFFSLEASWESWFNEEKRRQDVSWASSVTMSANQAALMIGPLLAPAIIGVVGTRGIVQALTAGFALVAALSWPGAGAAVVADTRDQAEAGPPEKPRAPLRLIATFALVWPVLGAFNLMLPLQVSDRGAGLVAVAVVDASLGIGVIVAGVLSARARLSSATLTKLVIACAVLGGVLWALPTGGATVVAMALSTFALGTGFGALRIALREYTATHYDSAVTGHAVALGNATAIPVLAVVFLVFGAAQPLVWIAPFLLVIVMSYSFQGCRTWKASLKI
ncbi:MFS transporter [Streptomyces sp. R302]|uniref:MFS transporter n=1 Tax=unclassified Streptomyces TaxID=2593676 RepID=UPI00145D4189|nr:MULTISPECIES: MFS transporter [unclassified Streptomyces]NML53004.1 MFS transporter [Streptomyces sp. R301]NML78839.1 MFS transporter [Streptomyces sp. R302]